MKFNRQFIVLLFSGSFVFSLQADDVPADNLLGSSGAVFAIQGDVVLTQAEIDAAISRIPGEYRLRYLRDGERVNQMVAKLLRTKLIAAEAKKADYDTQNLTRIRMDLAGENELADAWVQQIIESTPVADYEALAHEYYLANPNTFMAPATIDVSHILVSKEGRGDDEALQLAQQLRQRIIADPSSFDDLVMEFSDDPSKNNNGGRFANTSRGDMVKPFEAAAFAMETPGEISEPVQTTYGYHLIRLNAKQPAAVLPFEEVKEQTIANVQKQSKEEFRVRYIKGLLTEKAEVKEGAVEAMLKRYYGENLELMPNPPQ